MKNTILRKPFKYKYYNAAFIIIAINIFVFLINSIMPTSRIYLSLIPGFIIQGNGYWQFFTYMFVHANLSHIFFNMLGLFFFGIHIEKRMGSSEFLLFYLFSGVGAGLFSFIVYLLTGQYGVILLGASGAIFAVLLAYATYFPDSMIYIMGIIPVKAPVLVIGYAAIELISQFMSINSGIGHLTHLAGFGFAYLYFVVRLGINPVDVFRGKNRGHWN